MTYPTEREPLALTDPAVLTVAGLRRWLADHDNLPEDTLLLAAFQIERICECSSAVPGQTTLGTPQLTRTAVSGQTPARPVVVLPQETTGLSQELADDVAQSLGWA